MRLTPKEQERLIVFEVAEIARRRYLRGLKLNYVEAAAIITDEILEQAREGKKTVGELIEMGSLILSEEDVMEGTAALIRDGAIPVFSYIDIVRALLKDGNLVDFIKKALDKTE